jgi:hypothetical protein
MFLDENVYKVEGYNLHEKFPAKIKFRKIDP